MEITTILNRKASAFAADPHLQAQLAQAVQFHAQEMSEHPSQPGDHAVLGYPPGTQPIHQMSHVPPQGMHHPGNGVPLMPNPYMHGGFPGNPQQMAPAPQPVQPTRSGTEPAPRIFHCSTCQKGFARRSDLARHGEFGPRLECY
jgi:hypothetical protein